MATCQQIRQWDDANRRRTTRGRFIELMGEEDVRLIRQDITQPGISFDRPDTHSHQSCMTKRVAFLPDHSRRNVYLVSSIYHVSSRSRLGLRLTLGDSLDTASIDHLFEACPSNGARAHGARLSISV